MKKSVIIIILLSMFIFIGIGRVDAATEMTCKYSLSDSIVYLTQTSTGGHVVNRMGVYGESSKTVWSGAGLKSSLSTFSDCPKYAHDEGDNKYTFNDTKKKGKKLSDDSPRFDLTTDILNLTPL